MKVSDYVVDFVAKLGVKHVFMLPGGGAMHLNDSLGRHPQLRYICNVHEQASAIAAEAYGQYTGLGCVMVTTGPGGTNAVTGIAGAWLESTPLLVVSGQVKRADLVGQRGVRQIGFQEIDIVRVVKPITKFATTVTAPEDIRRVMEEAAWHATHGRKGPVWVDIPLDVQASEVDPAALASFVPPSTTDHRQTLQAAVEKILTLLANAKRPIVLAGNGVRHAGAIDLFRRWAENLGVPVLTTWKALDFLRDTHPLYIGRPGAVGQRAANFAQQTCDLFISLGARLDYGQTAYNHAHFAPHAKHVIVDIDPAEIEKLQMSKEVALVADVRDFLEALLNRQAQTSMSLDIGPWRDQCIAWKAKYPIVLPEYRTVPHGVHNYVFVDELGRQLRDGDLLVPGSSGACSEVTCQAVPVLADIRFINSQGLGAMGFGVPAALGACLASQTDTPNTPRRTVCIDGDGGFPMNAQELPLIGKLKLPIKFFVLNNAGYGSIRTTQINYFQRRFMACDADTGLALPNLQKTAEAAGIPYRRIESHAELGAVIRAILDTDGPVICDVVMAPDQFTQPKVSSKQQADGKMVTMPMEDLWPFLDRAELERELTAGRSAGGG